MYFECRLIFTPNLGIFFILIVIRYNIKKEEVLSLVDTLMSIQIIPQTPHGEDVIPFVDEAIKVIEASGLKYRVGALETNVEGDMNALIILIQKMNDRMVELEAPSVIHQIKFYHVPEGISIETLTGKYDDTEK